MPDIQEIADDLEPEEISNVSYEILVGRRRADLAEQLGRILPPSTDFVWEIGCGHGHFLTAYARAHPERICIGIDIAGDRIARANRKRDRAQLANLHFIRADARLFLDVIPARARIAHVLILFPDPWPKVRHHKHRILQPDFLSAVACRVGEGARLYFRTDHEPYFNHASNTLRDHRDWLICDEPWVFEHETVFQNRASSFQSLVARLRSAAAP